MMPRHFQQYGYKSKRGRRCLTNAEITEIYFPTWKPSISDESLCLCLEFAGLVGTRFFWVFF